MRDSLCSHFNNYLCTTNKCFIVFMAGESQGGIKMRQSIDEQSISVCHMADSSKYDPNDYGFSSWIDYWANGRGVSSPVSPYCPCCELIKKVIVGGHVIAKSSGRVYITPVCTECNIKAANDESFRDKAFLVKQSELVPFIPKQ